MSTDFAALIRDASSPLEPQPTDTSADLRELSGIRAVLFDIYGTLVISGSGDVGVNAAAGRAGAFVDALAAVTLKLPRDVSGDEGVDQLRKVIEDHHAAARSEGVDYPEVEIREVWQHALDLLGVSVPDVDVGTVLKPESSPTVARLAVEYEARTNPTWTMPDAADVLRDLKRRGLLLGIVSNAQFFTPALFPAHLGDTLDGFGFDPDVRAWSWEHRRAKPGTFLYEHAAERLAEKGIEPREVLYVGNDLLNDCTPAQAVGFRTALFAGDARSLRLRAGDERVRDTRPTVTLTDLRQIVECLPPGG